MSEHVPGIHDDRRITPTWADVGQAYFADRDNAASGRVGFDQNRKFSRSPSREFSFCIIILRSFLFQGRTREARTSTTCDVLRTEHAISFSNSSYSRDSHHFGGCMFRVLFQIKDRAICARHIRACSAQLRGTSLAPNRPCVSTEL